MKSVLFAKLENSELEIQEECLACIQDILRRHKQEYITFISVVGEKARDLSQECLSALDHFGCLEIDEEALEEENEQGEEELNSTQGIFLLPSYRYATAYSKDASGSPFPVNVGLFGLVIRASRASVREYALLTNYVMLICSHTIFVNPFENQKVSSEMCKSYINRFLLLDAMDEKLVSILQPIKDSQPDQVQVDAPVEGTSEDSNASDTTSSDTAERLDCISTIVYPARSNVHKDIAGILQERNEELQRCSARKLVSLWDQVRSLTLKRCNEAYRYPAILSGFFPELVEELKHDATLVDELNNYHRKSALLVFNYETIENKGSYKYFFSTIAQRIYPSFPVVNFLLEKIGKYKKWEYAFQDVIIKAFECDIFQSESHSFVRTLPYVQFQAQVEDKLKQIERNFRKCITDGFLEDFANRLDDMYGGPEIRGKKDGYYERLYEFGPEDDRPADYKFSMKGFIQPEDYSEFRVLHLIYISGRLGHHYDFMVYILHKLRRLDKLMTVDFLHHLSEPELHPIPKLPYHFSYMLRTIGYYWDWKPMREFLDQIVIRKFENFMQAYEKYKKFIHDELLTTMTEEEKRSIREQGFILFLMLIKNCKFS